MGLRTVILDLDGTLVDSNHAHAFAWVDAFEEAGFRADFDVVLKLIGMGGDKLLPAAIGVPEDTDKGRRISDRRAEIFRERYLPTLRPQPGARELLARMRDDGLRLVVASSAGRDELDALLARAGVADLIDETTSSDDMDRSKPDPDVVEIALKRARSQPPEALMLGDTPYDVEAAARAGIGVVALRSGGWDDLYLRGALALYDDPADLLEHYDESPLSAAWSSTPHSDSEVGPWAVDSRRRSAVGSRHR